MFLRLITRNNTTNLSSHKLKLKIKNFQYIFFLTAFSFFYQNLSSQKGMISDKENAEKLYDTITINALEINYLDVRFIMILDNHIKEMHKNFMFNKKKYYCVVQISNILNDYYTNIYRKYLPNIDKIIDSISGDYKYFKNYVFYTIYPISVLTTNRESLVITRINTYPNLYYYKYKGWDVLFISDLNIEFPNTRKNKSLSFVYKNYFTEEEILKNNYGNFKDIYTFYDLEEHFVIQKKGKYLFSHGNGIPMKKKYLKKQLKNNSNEAKENK